MHAESGGVSGTNQPYQQSNVVPLGDEKKNVLEWKRSPRLRVRGTVGAEYQVRVCRWIGERSVRGKEWQEIGRRGVWKRTNKAKTKREPRTVNERMKERSERTKRKMSVWEGAAGCAARERNGAGGNERSRRQFGDVGIPGTSQQKEINSLMEDSGATRVPFVVGSRKEEKERRERQGSAQPSARVLREVI